MDTIKFTHKSLGHVELFSLQGRLDAESADEVKMAAYKIIDSNGCNLLLNLEGVDYVSSAGLRVLLQISRKIDERKGTFVLFAITNPVKEILSISGLDGYFNLAESEEEAYNLSVNS